MCNAWSSTAPGSNLRPRLEQSRESSFAAGFRPRSGSFQIGMSGNACCSFEEGYRVGRPSKPLFFTAWAESDRPADRPAAHRHPIRPLDHPTPDRPVGARPVPQGVARGPRDLGGLRLQRPARLDEQGLRGRAPDASRGARGHRRRERLRLEAGGGYGASLLVSHPLSAQCEASGPVVFGMALC